MSIGGRKRDRVLLLSPWLLSFLLFALFPLAFSLVLSFFHYSPLSPEGASWVGGEQYRRLVTDTRFWQSLVNTLIFVGGTIPATTVLSFLLALALDRAMPARGLFRSAFFLPSVISQMAPVGQT